MKNQEKNLNVKPDDNYLGKDLKKVVWVCVILIVILLALYIINWQTNFLSKLAELLMSKLVGR